MHALFRQIARSYLRTSWSTLSDDGEPLVIYSRDLISLGVVLDGYAERNYLEAIAKFLVPIMPEHSTFLDIGANIGNHTVFLSRYFDKTIAFEPNPRANRLLALNTENLPSVKVYPHGLSNFERELNFVTDEGNLGSTRVVDWCDTSSQSLRVRRLDETLKAEVSMRVGLIKIDVEGHELEVLEGAEETIRRDKPLIVMEILNRRKFARLPPAVSLLTDMGYHYFYEFTPTGFIGALPRRFWKYWKIIVGLLFGKNFNTAASIRRVGQFRKYDYAMIVCASCELDHVA